MAKSGQPRVLPYLECASSAPQPLIEYDYESENYTKSLWIAEGITSYYESLCMIRAGVCTQKEFLGLLSKEIESLQTRREIKPELKSLVS